MTRVFRPIIPSFGGEEECLELPNPQYSGPRTLVGVGKRELVLKVVRPNLFAGYDAMATIKVDETDAVDTLSPDNTNSRLVLDLAYQSELAGGGVNQGGVTAVGMVAGGRGRTLVDATRATTMTVPGSTTVNVYAYLESAIEGVALNLYATKYVEASVHWGTSANPVKPAYTLQSFPVGPLVPAVFRHIPRQSNEMLAMTTNPEFLSTLVAEFATDDNPAGLSIKYRVVDPFRNGCPIRNGVEFVRFTDATNLHVLVTPTFELNL